MKSFAVALLAAMAALAVLLSVAWMAGEPPLRLLAILVRGSVGSRYALESTLLKSVPLLLTGLSVAVAFRAGVWNIGGEGQFIIGALAAFVAARHGGPFALPLAIVAACIGGGAWAAIAALMRVGRNAPEVLTTILLNFVAIHLLGYAVNGPLQEVGGSFPQTPAIADSAALPMLGSSNVHAGLFIAIIAAIGCWWLLYRTAAGLRFRAAGYNASAARFAGINVDRQLVAAMATSGAIAGLAGGVELLGVTHRLYESVAAGYGYSGIAVALLAQLHPLATIASAAFFGALSSGAGELQRSAGISSSVATLGQAVVILTLILFSSLSRRRIVRRATDDSTTTSGPAAAAES